MNENGQPEHSPVEDTTPEPANNETHASAADAPEVDAVAAAPSGDEAPAKPARKPRKAAPRRRKKPADAEASAEAEPAAEAASGAAATPGPDAAPEVAEILAPVPAPADPEEIVFAAEEASAETPALDEELPLSSELLTTLGAEEGVMLLSLNELPTSDGGGLPSELTLDHSATSEEPAARLAPMEPSPEQIFLQMAEREVLEAGEPIPLLRRGAVPPSRRRGPVDAVLVPEAHEEEPLVEALELASDDETAPGAGILAITPELLAEVRETAERERSARPPKQPRRDQQSQQPQQRQPDRKGPAPMPPAPPTGPELILVAEALLETVPDDWKIEEEEQDSSLYGAFPEVPGAGGRKRRRRRDRDRREDTPATPAPAPVPQQTPVVLRAEEEAPRPERERDRDRDRDRDKREARSEREYKEILVNVEDRETRIAVIEEGRLVELHVEREERVVGSVYKGRVANVLPGMDAAFVDIGLERNAFLYVGDILFDDTSGRSGEAAPVRRTSRDVRIKDLAKPGQEILVQVVKGPRGTKGARVSTKMSIPGRYLVLMPDGDHLGVSRKIEDARERDRLKRIAEQFQPKGFGLIVRTEAEGRSESELRQDLDYLVNTWQSIVEKNKKVHAPAVIHKDLGIILKTIRDLFGSDVDKLVIDSQEEYEKAVDMLEQLAPDLVDRVHLYSEPEPLLIRYGVEEEIDRLLRRKVWLRNGAYLLLDTTEALTTIDVNTGKFVGTSSLAETILKTNLDAVDEIARQLRLRDIGGMIVLDFIDMASARDRQLVMRRLEDAFKKDRTRIKIAHISPLGLVEMTRKRTAEAVTDVMSHTCPYCQGRGRVWSPETMAIQIEREVMRLCAKQEIDAILIYANPEVAAQLVGAEGESVEQLERVIRRPVYIRARPDFHQEKYEITPGDMLEMERQMMPFHGGQVVECRVGKIELITPPRSAAWVDGYMVDLANGAKLQGQSSRVRLTDVRRSFAIGEPIAPSTAIDRSEPI